MPTTRLKVRVQPGAKANQVVGLADGVLRARIASPPEEGKANAALEAFLAEQLHVPKNSVRIVHGAASRDKLVEVEGLSLEEALRRLNEKVG